MDDDSGGKWMKIAIRSGIDIHIPECSGIAQALCCAEKVVVLVQRSQDVVGWDLAIKGGNEPVEPFVADRRIHLVFFHDTILAEQTGLNCF